MKVIDLFNNVFEMECIGCALANKSFVPFGIIKETENFILLQDPEVPIKGFLIITSKQHIKSITQLSKQQALEFFELCYNARTALSTFEDITECIFIQEERGHFHFWILPKYKWMTDLFENSLSTIRPILKHAEESLKTEQNIKDIEVFIECLKGLLNK